MNHIRFLTTNNAVCESHRELGEDFVVVTYEPGESCKMCLALILRHNAMEGAYNLLVETPLVNDGIVYLPAEKKDRHVMAFLAGTLFADLIFVFIMIIRSM